jgi:branched-chain amino acid transport system substrate-binding protein
MSETTDATNGEALSATAAFRETAPIKVGFLMDMVMPIPELAANMVDPIELVFADAYKNGVLDRPVQLIYREVEGLPRGTVQDVIDLYEEFVREGCVAMIGPIVSENAAVVQEEINTRFRVPTLSVCGSEDWQGEWTFLLPNGSMTDEPVIWAHLIAEAGYRDVGVIVEESLIGQQYLASFRRAAREKGIRIATEKVIAQTGQDITQVIREIRDSGAEALVHCGFGFGVAMASYALKALDWDPPRYMGTALETCYHSLPIWEAALGWVGLEQFDEGNEVATKFLDRFEEVHGRRPEFCSTVIFRDVAAVLVEAFAQARPLSRRGVKEALERVKMLPAASGAPGTRISFGKWHRHGYTTAGYLVARSLDPAGRERNELWATTMVGRFGQA